MNKIVYHVKTKNFPANYVVKMYDNANDTTNFYSGYTREEIFYCSEELIPHIFLPQKETVDIDR